MTKKNAFSIGLSCGCSVDTDGPWTWCPLHAAAEMMIQYLAEEVECTRIGEESFPQRCHDTDEPCIPCRARALLAKVKGE